jgi:hypothetical protein
LRPLPAGQGVVFLIGVLAPPEDPALRIVEGALYVVQGLHRRLPKPLVLEDLRCVEVERDQVGVVLQHLLEVGEAPVAGGGVAEPSALHVVIHPAFGHPVEGAADHLRQSFVAAAAADVFHQEEQAGLGVGELGGLAEAAVDRVVSSGDQSDQVQRDGPRQPGAGPGHGAGSLLPPAGDLLGPPLDLGAVAPVILEHPEEDLPHLHRRDVGGPGEDLPVRGEEGCGGPSAHVVTGVDVRAAVCIHPDGDEVGVDELGDLGVRIGSGVDGIAGDAPVHHVAPVAPGGRDAEEDGLVLLLRLPEGLFAPLPPLHPRLPHDPS